MPLISSTPQPSTTISCGLGTCDCVPPFVGGRSCTSKFEAIHSLHLLSYCLSCHCFLLNLSLGNSWQHAAQIFMFLFFLQLIISAQRMNMNLPSHSVQNQRCTPVFWLLVYAYGDDGYDRTTVKKLLLYSTWC